MHGIAMSKKTMEKVLLTPSDAAELLEHNTENRPLSQQHVQRIARQIIDGKWKFNGDSIKVSESGDVLDGQHRCWAVLEAKQPVETIIVRGIKRDAFATIDTVRKSRSGGDTLALCGASLYRNVVAAALQWLLRWQRGVLTEYKIPQNKIENSDIELAHRDNPQMIQAVERAMKLRTLGNPALIAFLYYVLSNRNSDLAERMISTLEDPSAVGVNDPFFRLRAYFTADHHKKKDPIVTIALAFKAINAAAAHSKIQTLTWRNQGSNPEQFPKLLAKSGK